MPQPSRFHYLMRIVLAIPMFILTILFIAAGSKAHKTVFIILGVLFFFISLYCLYFLVTSLCWGVCRLHRKHNICHRLYYLCCTCFITDTECCTAQENNRCPCIKWCCVDDEESQARAQQITNVFMEDLPPPETPIVRTPDSAAEALLLQNGADYRTNSKMAVPYPQDGAPPSYASNQHTKYEGW